MIKPLRQGDSLTAAPFTINVVGGGGVCAWSHIMKNLL